MSSPRVTGLVLTGGGARAAYQVGVLRAVCQIRREAGCSRSENPFPVITGTSAGGINAAALAAGADEFELAVARLAHIWSRFKAEQVYRTDSLGVIRTGAGWLTMMSIGWAIKRWRKLRPRSLLDNSPLNELLDNLVPVSRVRELIERGHVRALAIAASSYSTGHHVTFYDAAEPVPGWVRSQRLAVHGPITARHLLASSAIPFLFPAQSVNVDDAPQWMGDGSMRQTAPISPAVHLGADRVLVIGAGRMHEPPATEPVARGEYPNMAQIAGHAMSSIFLDALSVDIERLQRINHTLGLLPPEARRHTHLRPIDILVISPSQRLDDIAARHINALPLPIRALLGGVGVSGMGRTARGSALASYLLFESDFTRELMALGEADTLARRDEVKDFLGC
ncbi:MAG TPA: patatin-like phospholipase family protein [Ideonella sp.]|uniref:patatin-like phospholipase family protein n=1 Tax=Ideonella sp. TaxID=1929293 RepID=UPI002D0C3074|nr:patatin-like phospholipase family protein [Ideonella sp.]HSI47884.1 patatin-like phospholipase family protein [Ideonella sp.]